MSQSVTSNREKKKTTKTFKGAFQSIGKLINEMDNAELMDSDSDLETKNEALSKMWATPVRRKRITTTRKPCLSHESESESEDELNMSYPPPRRAQTPMTEAARLEKMRELLEDKIEEMKQRMKKPGTTRALRESTRFTINNMDAKLDNLLKRIVLEGQRGETTSKARTLERPSKGSTLGFNSQCIIEKRKLESRLAIESLKEVVELQDMELERKGTDRSISPTVDKLKESKNLGKWGKWEKLSERSTAKIENPSEKASNGTQSRGPSPPKLILGPPSATRKFFPPIPAQDAKKRPRDAIPLYFRQLEDVPGRGRKKPQKPEKRILLIPNKKRVASKRALVYIKQLHFAEEHGVDTKNTLENLNAVMQDHGDILPEFTQPPISRQKLYMMGALSRRHLYPPTERPPWEDFGDEDDTYN